jgi:DNA-binding transcriptional regulator YbjK
MSGSQKVVIKRKQFSLNKKISILKQIDSKRKQVTVAKELGITYTTVLMTLKDQERIMKLYERSALCPYRKHLHLRDHQKVEEAINTWFKNVRAANIPFTGPILQEKAWEFTRQMGVKDFEAISG